MSKTLTQAEQILTASTLFKDIPEKELSNLAAHCVVKDLNPGETIFYEKEESKSLYIVAKGTVAIKKGSGGGDENVGVLGNNQHFGEMAFLMRDGVLFEKRSATAEVGGEATLLLEVPYEALLKYFSATPSVGLIFFRNLAVSLASRIRRTTEDLAGVRSLRLRHT